MTIRRFPNALRASATLSRPSACPDVRVGSASASSSSGAYERELDAIGRPGRSCSRGVRRSRVPASWTSASSCTPRRPTSACASAARAGRIRHFPWMTILHYGARGRRRTPDREPQRPQPHPLRRSTSRGPPRALLRDGAPALLASVVLSWTRGARQAASGGSLGSAEDDPAPVTASALSPLEPLLGAPSGSDRTRQGRSHRVPTQ